MICVFIILLVTGQMSTQKSLQLVFG